MFNVSLCNYYYNFIDIEFINLFVMKKKKMNKERY